MKDTVDLSCRHYCLPVQLAQELWQNTLDRWPFEFESHAEVAPYHQPWFDPWMWAPKCPAALFHYLTGNILADDLELSTQTEFASVFRVWFVLSATVLLLSVHL